MSATTILLAQILCIKRLPHKQMLMEISRTHLHLDHLPMGTIKIVNTQGELMVEAHLLAMDLLKLFHVIILQTLGAQHAQMERVLMSIVGRLIASGN